MKSYLSPIVAAACTLGMAGNQKACLQQDASTNTESMTESSWKSNFGAEVSTGYDVWHGLPDGTYPDNNGVHFGANLSALLCPKLGLGRAGRRQLRHL